jgi:hypothetical protein
LRLFEVATDDINSVSEVRVKDVLIEAGVNTWYVHVPPDARTYRLHIGYRTLKGMFFALAKSNVCAMPVMKRFGIPATARASLAFYNTREELEALAKGIQKAIEVFA